MASSIEWLIDFMYSGGYRLLDYRGVGKLHGEASFEERNHNLEYPMIRPMRLYKNGIKSINANGTFGKEICLRGRIII